jgi:hypothetical protein
MLKLKNGLRLMFPKFCSNILKILLFREEEKLACFLTAYYEIHLFEEMILCAIDKGHYLWLHYLWAFGKNIIGVRRYNEHFGRTQEKVHFNRLILMIKRMKDKDELARMDVIKVCEWMTLAEDNILQALLNHFYEEECLQYMGYYSRFLDKHLF